MIRGLPSLARLALGPSGLGSRSWATFTHGSSWSAPSSLPSGTSVRLSAERSTRRCKCKIYSTVYTFITYESFWQSRGAFVGHIHLDKNTFSILFHKRTICSSLLIILFDGDCVHLNVNNFNLTSTQQWVGIFILFNMIYNHTQVT
jgi:hypothetical protein